MNYPVRMYDLSTDIRARYHHTPGRGFARVFHSVLTAGSARLDPGFPLKSWSHPGHDLLLGVEGSGLVQLGNRSFRIGPGELVWANCNDSDVRWPARSEPWTIYWTRVDSPQMAQLADMLNVAANPIFVPRDLAATLAGFETILELMRARPISMDASLNAAIGALVAMFFEARLARDIAGPHPAAENRVGDDLHAVLRAMRRDYDRRWSIRDFAELMGLSETQFFRRFRTALGVSPMDYLRRERINNAKRALAGSSDPIHLIAERVGYGDPYYFSRDFKKVVGIPPRDYRRKEQM